MNDDHSGRSSAGARQELIEALDSVSSPRERPRQRSVIAAGAVLGLAASGAAVFVGSLSGGHARTTNAASTARPSASGVVASAGPTAATAHPTPMPGTTRVIDHTQVVLVPAPADGASKLSTSEGGATRTKTSGAKTKAAAPAAKPATKTAPKAAAAPPPVHSLVGGHSGLCLDPAGSGSGAHVLLETCTGSARQKWTFEGDGTIRSEGLCMDVNNNTTSPGTYVVVNTCAGKATQKFTRSGNFIVDTGANGECVNAAGGWTAVDTPAEVWTCVAGSTDETWTLA